MKKYIALLALVVIVQSGCKKFLQVESLHKISGNIYWKSKADVDAFTLDLYARFRNKLTSTSFLPAVGDLRSGFVRSTIQVNSNSANEKARRAVYDAFAVNNLKSVLNGGNIWNQDIRSGNNLLFTSMNFRSITLWLEFYQVIQGANIVIDQVDKGVPGLTDADEKQFKGEAAFIRCLAYFMMVRIYGDVVYYTEPYTKQTGARENMVLVINKCIADLKSYKDGLPVAYPDPSFRAIRATKGAALDLLMNLNMWNAGFDKANAQKYYRETADYGKELIDLNTYQLLPLENFKEVMKGRSMEGIFEFNQSTNYEVQPNPIAFFGEMVLKFPNKAAGSDNSSSHAFIKPSYLTKLYVAGADKRKDLWFDPLTMLSGNGNFELLKFKGDLTSGSNGLYGVPEWGLIIFRYAEAILLRAEALAELGEETEARVMLSLVRARAGAQHLGESGTALKDAIFMERGKELMGEGHLYFDLIRTGRILSSEWTDNPLTQDQFDRGGWTWPIDASAVISNPSLTLNSYWQ